MGRRAQFLNNFRWTWLNRRRSEMLGNVSGQSMTSDDRPDFVLVRIIFSTGSRHRDLEKRRPRILRFVSSRYGKLFKTHGTRRYFAPSRGGQHWHSRRTASAVPSMFAFDSEFWPICNSLSLCLTCRKKLLFTYRANMHLTCFQKNNRYG